MTAAAVHLCHLATDRRPTIAEVMQIPRFDLTSNGKVGQLFFMGCDDQGNRVYVLGLGSEHGSFSHLIDQYLRLLGLEPTDYRLVNCLPCVNWYTRIGGFTSRNLGWVWFGRRLAAVGVSKSFGNYVRLVQLIRASLAQREAFLDWSISV